MALPDSRLTANLVNEEQCVSYLEELRWPAGVACPSCGNRKISRFQAKGKSGKTRQICQCLDRECRYQFSATTGTIFHDSHLPLSKWFEAMRLLGNPDSGTTVNQLRLVLGVQYKTARNVAERILRALAAGTIDLPGASGAAAISGLPAAPVVSATRFNKAYKAPQPSQQSAKPRANKPVRGVPKLPKPVQVPAPTGGATPTMVDSMLSVFTSAMNLSVKPPLAAVNYLKKKILD